MAFDEEKWTKNKMDASFKLKELNRISSSMHVCSEKGGKKAVARKTKTENFKILIAA